MSAAFPGWDAAERVEALAGTPCYVYREDALREAARAALRFPNAFGLTARFAMKALPNRNVLRLFAEEGLHFDCSSGHEVERALAAGIPGERLLLTGQELPRNLASLLRRGVTFHACSLKQIRAFADAGVTKDLGLRFNPGLGSGGTARTNVGGPASSFGIWVDKSDEAAALVDGLGLRVTRIHTHIGSGSDPAVWQKVALMTLDLVRRFPSVQTVDLGGGFKVGRMPGETTTDLQAVGAPVRDAFLRFADETGRRLRLEIEPGTWLSALAGFVLARVEDVVDTGEGGYRFVKLNTGMTEVLRPSLYGAQHPIRLQGEGAETPAVVSGHCCESGDILTPAPGDPEALAPRPFPDATVGAFAWIGGAGAYCAGMSAKNYNSFPEAAEVLLRSDGTLALLRRRQDPSEIWVRETDAIVPPSSP